MASVEATSLDSRQVAGRKEIWIPAKDASEPRTGFCYIDHYWITRLHEGQTEVLFLQGYPQCNRDEAVALKIRKQLYPDYNVQKVPAVYMMSVHRADKRHNKLGE